MKRSQLFAWTLILVSSGLFLQAETASFSVKRSGVGPKQVILIPEICCDGSVWDQTVQTLQGQAIFHTLTIAGFSSKKNITRKDHLVPLVVKDIVHYLRQNKIRKPILVGHGLGGFIALSIGIAHPDLPGGVFVVDAYTTLIPPTPGLNKELQAFIGEQILSSMKTAPPGHLWERQEPYIRSAVGDPAVGDRLVAMAQKSDAATVLQAMTAMIQGDLAPTIGVYKGPLTLVLAVPDPKKLPLDKRPPGMLDTLEEMKEQALATGRACFQATPQVQVKTVENSRHFIMYDQPAILSSILLDFLENGSGRK